MECCVLVICVCRLSLLGRDPLLTLTDTFEWANERGFQLGNKDSTWAGE